MISAPKANESGLWKKFRELRTECLEINTDECAGLVGGLRMAKRSVTLEKQLRESDRKL